MGQVEGQKNEQNATDWLNLVSVSVPALFVVGGWVWAFSHPELEARVALTALAVTSIFGITLGNAIKNFDLSKKFEKFTSYEREMDEKIQIKMDGIISHSRILTSFADSDDLLHMEEYARWLEYNRSLAREVPSISSLCDWQRKQTRTVIRSRLQDCRNGELFIDVSAKELVSNKELLQSVQTGPIYAVSFEDTEFWNSSYGKTFLEAQKSAINREGRDKIEITRVFVTTAKDTNEISPIMNAQKEAGIKVFHVDFNKVKHLNPQDVVIYGENLVRRGYSDNSGGNSFSKSARLFSSKTVVAEEIERAVALIELAEEWAA
jgi:hypothetical protein